MTSNLGTSIQAKNANSIQENIQSALKAFFRPEFLNRIDDVVEFASLDQANICEIVKIQLQQVSERLKQKNIQIQFSDSLVNWLGEKGFDPVFGARPLKRLIQTEVLNPLAKKMIAGDIKADSVVKLNHQNNQITFSS